MAPHLPMTDIYEEISERYDVGHILLCHLQQGQKDVILEERRSEKGMNFHDDHRHHHHLFLLLHDIILCSKPGGHETSRRCTGTSS